MGGWRRKLERRERKALEEVLTIASEEAAEPSGEEVAVEPSLSVPESGAYPYPDADGEVAVLDLPVASDVGTAKHVAPQSGSVTVHDLFEDVISSEKASGSIFRKVEQMSLF